MTYMTITFQDGHTVTDWVEDMYCLRAAYAWMQCMKDLRLAGYTNHRITIITLDPDQYHTDAWRYAENKFLVYAPM